MVDYYKIELVKVEDVASDIKRFTFKPNEKFDFKPGNYVLMFNNKNPRTAGMSRPFTISSTPINNKLEFIIKKVGVFTTELFNLKLGDVLDIEAPHGVMSYNEEHDGKKVIFIAGGTGITPYLSMRKHANENKHRTSFKLFYTVRNKDELIVTDADRIVITSDGNRIDKEFLSENISKEELNNSFIFVCGPPPFEDAIKNILEGLNAKNVLLERS